MSEDVYSQAAIKEFPFMHGILPSVGNPPHEIARFKTQNAEKRKYAESLKDRRWRNAFLGWCDYVDRRIAESEASYASRDERRRSYREEQQRRNNEVARLLAENPPA